MDHGGWPSLGSKGNVCIWQGDAWGIGIYNVRTFAWNELATSDTERQESFMPRCLDGPGTSSSSGR